MHMRPARDRRGRGLRGPLLPPDVPRHATRSQAFDDLALDCYAPLNDRFPEQLAGLDLAVDTVPRMRLRADLTVLPDEIFADGPVPLGRLILAGVDRQGQPTRARIVLFRMPIEQRAATPRARRLLVTTALTALVATYLNLDPRDIDPQYAW